MRKRLRLRSVLVTIATLALLAAWTIFLRPAFLGGPASYVVVSGKSLQPTLWTGDLVVAFTLPEYQVGDIVAYRAAGGVIIHRIIGGDAEDGFAVQGDNNQNADAFLPQPQHIMGAAMVKIPGAGTLF